MNGENEPQTKIEVINPQMTKWCTLETATQIADWIKENVKDNPTNMLLKSPEEILEQMEKGLSRIAITDNELYGHITLWKYSIEDCAEVGSLIVHPKHCNKGIGTELIKKLSEDFSMTSMIIATAKAGNAKKAFLKAGFKTQLFESLSGPIIKECCVCYNNLGKCSEADKECRLLVKENKKKEIGKTQKIQFEIINPQGTEWCNLETAKTISTWINKANEKDHANLLPQTPEKILKQMEEGTTLLAICQDQMIGHVTLWMYKAPGWAERGSLVVNPNSRRAGVGGALTKEIINRFPKLNIIVILVEKDWWVDYLVSKQGLLPVSFSRFREISEIAWKECCFCHKPPQDCPKQDKECKLVIRLSEP